MTALILMPAGSTGYAEAYEETEKEHSWFSLSKPAKDNPAEQMAYAKKLLQERKASKASRAFRSLAFTWPGSEEAPMAQWAHARILDQQDELEDAFDAYQILIEKFSGRFPDYEKALTRQFEISQAIMNKRRGGFFFGGFSAPERAIPYFEKVIRNAPRATFAPEAQYLIGKAYEESFDYDLAVMAYSAALHRYPGSDFSEASAFGRARSLYLISKDFPNDIKSLEEAWAGVMVFIRSYPESMQKDEAARMRDTLFDRKVAADYDIAVYYDRVAKKPEAARENYERIIDLYPDSSKATLARQRLEELTPADPGPTTEKETKL